MKITTVLATKGGRACVRRFSREHGPCSDEMNLFSPCGTIRIDCSQPEVEEFERDTGTKLDTDVLRGKDWAAVVGWMRDNAGLRVAGAFDKPELGQTPARFVWVVGAIRETYPDIPAEVENEPGLVLWDRQERAMVMRVSPAYAQAMCLELDDCAAWSPFTTIEQWLNSLTNEDLASENLPINKPSTKGPQ